MNTTQILNEREQTHGNFLQLCRNFPRLEIDYPQQQRTLKTPSIGSPRNDCRQNGSYS